MSTCKKCLQVNFNFKRFYTCNNSFKIILLCDIELSEDEVVGEFANILIPQCRAIGFFFF